MQIQDTTTGAAGEAVMTIVPAPDPAGSIAIPAAAVGGTTFGVGITFEVGSATPTPITLYAADVSKWLQGDLSFTLPGPLDLPQVKDLVDWVATTFGFKPPDWTQDPWTTIGSARLQITAFTISTQNKALTELSLAMTVFADLQLPYIPVKVTSLMFSIDYKPTAIA